MNYKKYHLLTGTVSLVINILLPTLIYNYYHQLINIYEETVTYGILAMLFLLWVATLIIALRELGGLLLHQVNQSCDEKFSRYLD